MQTNQKTESGKIRDYLFERYFSFFNLRFLMLILGFLWEFLEIIVVNTAFTRNLLRKYWFVPERYWDESIENKYTDLIINIIGYHVGNVYL